MLPQHLCGSVFCAICERNAAQRRIPKVCRLQIATHFLHIARIGCSESLQTPTLLSTDNPVGRNLKDQHQCQQKGGGRQQRHANKAEEISNVYGVAGKAVNAVGIQAGCIRERKICQRNCAQAQAAQIAGQPTPGPPGGVQADGQEEKAEKYAGICRLVNAICHPLLSLHRRKARRPAESGRFKKCRQCEPYEQEGSQEQSPVHALPSSPATVVMGEAFFVSAKNRFNAASTPGRSIR